jgi:hypothetical protein
MAASHPDALAAQIKEKFPDSSLALANGEWFIVAPSTTTTTELSEKLGITDGAISSAIVMSVSSYYGRTQVATWEWISAKMGTTQNAS